MTSILAFSSKAASPRWPVNAPPQNILPEFFFCHAFYPAIVTYATYHQPKGNEVRRMIFPCKVITIMLAVIGFSLLAVGCGGGKHESGATNLGNTPIQNGTANAFTTAGTAADFSRISYNTIYGTGSSYVNAKAENWQSVQYAQQNLNRKATLQSNYETDERNLLYTFPLYGDSYSLAVSEELSYRLAMDDIRRRGQRMIDAMKNPYASDRGRASDGLDYSRITNYVDGSRLVEYFSDPARAKPVGYVAIAAPQWNGSDGKYPVLIRALAAFGEGDGRLQADSITLVGDAQGATGRTTVRITDSKNVGYIFQTSVDSGGIVTRTVRFGTAANFVTLTTIVDGVGTYIATIEFSAGGDGIYVVNNDGSGSMSLRDARNRSVFLLNWNADKTGTYIRSDNVVHSFKNVDDFIRNGKA